LTADSPYMIGRTLQIRGQVLEYLSIHPNSTPIEISGNIGIHPALIGTALYELELKELISFANSSRQKKGPIYFIKSEGYFTWF